MIYMTVTVFTSAFVTEDILRKFLAKMGVSFAVDIIHHRSLSFFASRASKNSRKFQ